MPKGYYTNRRNWTEQEIEYLHDFAGIYSIKELSYKLGRSEVAIKVFRYRHKMPSFWDNVYTYTILSEELNRSRTVLRRWLERGWITGKRASYSSRFGKKAMLFQYDDVIRFLKEYYKLFADKMPNNLYLKNIVKQELKKACAENSVGKNTEKVEISAVC